MGNRPKFDANMLLILDSILVDGNLTRAADRLGMTAPAVSGALARLRRQIGDPIIQRAGRNHE